MTCVRQRTAEILGLLLLMSYAIIGADLVPFHGDEATLLHVGQDPTGQDPTGSADSEDAAGASSTSTARRLVLVNGTVPTFAVMLSWKAAGYSAADLNDPWIWGRGLTWNRDAGRMPSQGLLAAARRPAVWFTAASIPLIFAVTRRWAGLGAASITCLLFATHATVLLHGRRAMMEGAFLFFGLATVLVAIVWAGRGVADAKRTGWPDAALAVALAAASGFAVASKHSALATVAGVYAALIAVSLRPSVANGKHRLGWVAASGVGSILVFLALNPAWWDAPLARTRFQATQANTVAAKHAGNRNRTGARMLRRTGTSLKSA
jgi:hypothetical protein